MVAHIQLRSQNSGYSAYGLPHTCAFRGGPRRYVASYRELEKIFFSISVLSNISLTFSSLQDPTSQVHWPGKWCFNQSFSCKCQQWGPSPRGDHTQRNAVRERGSKAAGLMPILFPSPGVNSLQQSACSCLQFPESCFWYFVESLVGKRSFAGLAPPWNVLMVKQVLNLRLFDHFLIPMLLNT